MLVYIVLLVALVSLFMAWQANHTNKDLSSRLAQMHTRLYQVRRDTQESQETLQQAITELRIQLLRSQGELQVTGDMTVDEVLLTHPMAQQVLAGFHIGGCTSCAVDGAMRLDLAMASSGQPLEPVLVALNNLLAASQGGSISSSMLKTPNVELTF